jgi:hypothetical protein
MALTTRLGWQVVGSGGWASGNKLRGKEAGCPERETAKPCPCQPVHTRADDLVRRQFVSCSRG